MISRIFSGMALILAILTTLATSSPTYQRTLAEGLYQVTSDCPNAQSSGEMRIENEISSGIQRLEDGIRFGFPSNILISGRVHDPDRGDAAKVQDGDRECKVLLWETQENSGLFACSNGSELECTIHLRKI